VSGAVLILGASSSIARAVAHRFARAGHPIILAGRDVEDAGRDAADLRLRYGVAAAARPFDATDFASHRQLVDACTADAAATLEGVVLCHGTMAEQEDAARDFAVARRMIDTNYTSAVSVLNPLADYFERRKAGFVCAVSSVAGDRGRQSNYLYGSTKAALSTYLQGLRNRLSKSGVRVVTVKPGFVDTALTYGRPGMFLVATPQRVGADVFRAVRRGRSVVYTPWFWQGIMGIIKSIPEPVFKRMKL
jgi:decaprenylphospho-beta-D-erythro-pentofuranosid-2-ulose 2-reductase